VPDPTVAELLLGLPKTTPEPKDLLSQAKAKVLALHAQGIVPDREDERKLLANELRRQFELKTGFPRTPEEQAAFEALQRKQKAELKAILDKVKETDNNKPLLFQTGEALNVGVVGKEIESAFNAKVDTGLDKQIRGQMTGKAAEVIGEGIINALKIGFPEIAVATKALTEAASPRQAAVGEEAQIAKQQEQAALDKASFDKAKQEQAALLSNEAAAAMVARAKLGDRDRQSPQWLVDP